MGLIELAMCCLTAFSDENLITCHSNSIETYKWWRPKDEFLIFKLFEIWPKIDIERARVQFLEI